MRTNRLLLFGGLGCFGLAMLVVIACVGLLLFLVPSRFELRGDVIPEIVREPNITSADIEQQQAIPTLTPVPAAETEAFAQLRLLQDSDELQDEPNVLTELYEQVNPGVVSIGVLLGGPQGGGAGSGFVLDEAGHIVTNHHVVAGAERVFVVFFNGLEAEAEVIGTDDDSDVAIVRVDELPPEVHPLPITDSDSVQPGEWVVAIGNPFGQQGSMTLGIVSAVGRLIPSLALTGAGSPFSIPQAIQTDAAINPGNSGGPLLNLQGQVVGVNAQIQTGGSVPANAGVGFAIPSNVVRHVVPVLIETGEFVWPWLGISGGSVNLLVAEANDLPTQQGAYIAEVIPGSPADDAGLQGGEITEVEGLQIPVGGDVILSADGEEIDDFEELLNIVAFQQPGEEIDLIVLRDGDTEEVTVELEARPAVLESEVIP